jgi:hypothetical protein
VSGNLHKVELHARLWIFFPDYVETKSLPLPAESGRPVRGTASKTLRHSNLEEILKIVSMLRAEWGLCKFVTMFDLSGESTPWIKVTGGPVLLLLEFEHNTAH